MNDISVMIEDVKLNYRVGVIIKNKDKILLEYFENNGQYVIPGGRVKTLEDSKVALRRELQEEMHYDLDINDISLKSVIENFFQIKEKKYHELFFVYVLNKDLEHEDMTNYDSKTSHYVWENINELDSINLLPLVIKDTIKESEFTHKIVKGI